MPRQNEGLGLVDQESLALARYEVVVCPKWALSPRFDVPVASRPISMWPTKRQKKKTVDRQPMQVQGRKRRQQSGWNQFLATMLPSMGDMPFAKKMAALSEEWKNMKGRGNIASGGQQATTKKSMAREKLR